MLTPFCICNGLESAKHKNQYAMSDYNPNASLKTTKVIFTAIFIRSSGFRK